MLIKKPDDTNAREPVFRNFPAVVIALSALIIGVTTIQFLVSDQIENEMWLTAAVVGGPDFVGLQQPLGPLAPLVLHTLLHMNVLHIVMNMTAMLSFGPAIAVALKPGASRWIAFILFFCLCAIGGALAQLAYYQVFQVSGAAIGASSAMSGFLPAAGYLMGGWRGAMRLSWPWVAINVVLAVAELFTSVGIAWPAHLGGLAVGLLVFPMILRQFGRVRLQRPA